MTIYNVLFVDDDPFMLKALLRTARRLRPDWKFIGCESSALWQQSWQNSVEPDLIITDLQMPELSGNELLAEASDILPAAMRVLLTGDTSETVITHASQFAHGIIAKPFSEQDVAQLFVNLERLHALPLSLSCRRKLGAFNHLPMLPEFVQRLKLEFSNPQSDLTHIGEILKHDPVLTAKLVQIANSAFMGFNSSVSTVHDAVIRLGASMTEAIVTLYLLVEENESESHLESQRKLISDSLNHAAVARDFARLAGLKRQQQDMVYSAAIFSAIGSLLLLRYQQDQISNPMLFGNLQPGFSNSNILTVYLLTLWGYNTDLCDVILWQDWPSPEQNKNEKYAFILFITKQYIKAENACQRNSLIEIIEPEDFKSAFQRLIKNHPI